MSSFPLLLATVFLTRSPAAQLPLSRLLCCCCCRSLELSPPLTYVLRKGPSCITPAPFSSLNSMSRPSSPCSPLCEADFGHAGRYFSVNESGRISFDQPCYVYTLKSGGSATPVQSQHGRLRGPDDADDDDEKKNKAAKRYGSTAIRDHCSLESIDAFVARGTHDGFLAWRDVRPCRPSLRHTRRPLHHHCQSRHRHRRQNSVAGGCILAPGGPDLAKLDVTLAALQSRNGIYHFVETYCACLSSNGGTPSSH